MSETNGKLRRWFMPNNWCHRRCFRCWSRKIAGQIRVSPRQHDLMQASPCGRKCRHSVRAKPCRTLLGYSGRRSQLRHCPRSNVPGLSPSPWWHTLHVGLAIHVGSVRRSIHRSEQCPRDHATRTCNFHCVESAKQVRTKSVVLHLIELKTLADKHRRISSLSILYGPALRQTRTLGLQSSRR